MKNLALTDDASLPFKLCLPHLLLALVPDILRMGRSIRTFGADSSNTQIP